MTPELWILLGAVIAVLLAAFLLVRLWLARRGNRLSQAIRDVAIDRLQNVLLPDGMGGQIQLEYVLLTSQGLVVVDVKAFEGTIFASDRMEEWTVIGKNGRFTFPNPLGTLYDRMGAAHPVSGRFVGNQFHFTAQSAQWQGNGVLERTGN